MIETTTIKSAKSDRSNQIQENSNKGIQSFKPQAFQNASGKNPCHDGCNVNEKQLQANTNATEAANETNTVSDQSSGVEKTSGGNCPGSNIIANILQELIQALEATRIGR